MTGKSGNPERKGRIVALANGIYNYKELEWSVFSSNTDDFIDSDWLFWTVGDLTENEVSD